MDGEQIMSRNPLQLLEPWLGRHRRELDSLGMRAEITWGPVDRNPAAAWLDFNSNEISSRLIVWSNGSAELVIGNATNKEVLLEEHREISTEIGLDNVLETIEAITK
jgi:hypothetical protein